MPTIASVILASKGERFLAFAADLLFVFWPGFAVQLAEEVTGVHSDGREKLAMVTMILLVLVNVVLSIQTGQSVGKKVTHLRIVDLECQPLTTGALVMRSGLTGFFYAFSAFGISLIDAAFAGLREDGKALHRLDSHHLRSPSASGQRLRFYDLRWRGH